MRDKLNIPLSSVILTNANHVLGYPVQVIFTWNSQKQLPALWFHEFDKLNIDILTSKRKHLLLWYHSHSEWKRSIDRFRQTQSDEGKGGQIQIMDPGSKQKAKQAIQRLSWIGSDQANMWQGWWVCEHLLIWYAFKSQIMDRLKRLQQFSGTNLQLFQGACISCLSLPWKLVCQQWGRSKCNPTI